jgi:hypothetical protein
MRLLLVAALAAALVTGCYPRREPDRFVIERIPIESVEVVSPGRPAVRVIGNIGDGCSEFDGMAQEQRGRETYVTITRRQRTTGGCRQIDKPYDEVIELRGEYPPGQYVVDVNGVRAEFVR